MIPQNFKLKKVGKGNVTPVIIEDTTREGVSISQQDAGRAEIFNAYQL